MTKNKLIVDVEICDIEVSVFQNNENLVAAIEFSKEDAVVIIVEATNIRVKPYFTPT